MIHAAIIYDDEQASVNDITTNLSKFLPMIQLDFLHFFACPDLQKYDVVLCYSGVSETEPLLVTQRIKHYISCDHGSVVMCTFTNHCYAFMCLHEFTDYHPMTLGETQDGGMPDCTIGRIVVPDHPLFAGVKNICIQSSGRMTDSQVANGAFAIAYWSDDVILAAERQLSQYQSIIALNVHPASTDVYPDDSFQKDSDGPRLIHNALVYCATRNNRVLNRLLKNASKKYADVIILV